MSERPHGADETNAAPVPPGTPADPSIGELLTQLSAQTGRLVRDEMKLAQKELHESLRHAGRGAGLISAAGVLAFLAAATLIAAAVSALALLLPLWAAALIIGVMLLASAAVVAMISRREATSATPAAPRTITNVKRDVDSLRSDVRVRPDVKGAGHAGHA